MESLSGKNLAIVVAVSIVFLILLAVSGEMLLNALVVVCSLFLICLVLIQRGRGGGLAGAFGGMGGSSAFGTKAGDVFTWTTIVTAIIWFMIAMRLVMLSNTQGPRNIFGDAPGQSRQVPLTDGSSASKAVSDAIEKAKSGAPVTPAPADTTGLPAALEDEPKDAAPAVTPEPAPAAPAVPAPAPTPAPAPEPAPAPASTPAPAPEPAKTP